MYYLLYCNADFNGEVRISVEQTFLSVQNDLTGMFDLPIQVEVFDVNGRRVAQWPSPSVPLPEGEGGNSFSHWEKVAEGRMRAFTWQPAPTLPSSVYLVRARFDPLSLSGAETSGSGTITKRIVYLK